MGEEAQPTPEAPVEEPKTYNPPAPRSDEDLVQLAQDILDGKVFTDRHIPDTDPDGIRRVFPLLWLGMTEGLANMLREHCGLMFEYLEKAGPRSCNGYPMFLSCQILCIGDVPKMFAAYNHLKAEKDKVQAAVNDAKAGALAAMRGTPP